MDLSRLLAFVVLIFVHGVYCDTECDCNNNKELMELIHKDYLQMRLENFKIMSRLRRLEVSKQSVSTQSDPITAKGSSQLKAVDEIDAKYAKITAQLERVNDIDAKYANITAQLERVDEIDAKYAKLNAQQERINKLEANIAHLTEQSEKNTRNIEDKLAKTVENLEQIDEIEDKIVKIEEMMNRNEASSTNITAQMERIDKIDVKLRTITSQITGILEKMNDYKMAFDFRNIVTKTISAYKTGRNKFDSNVRKQIENIKHLFTEFKNETATLVHDQRVSLSTKHETFTEQMTRQVAEVNHQMYTYIGDIALELNKVAEEVSKTNSHISALNEIRIEDKTGSSQSKAVGEIDAKYAKITAQLERVNDIDAKYANITAQLERVDEIDAKYAKLNAQPERINKLEANIAHLTEQSEKKTRDIEVKLAKSAKNLERIDKIEDNIIKIEEKIEVTDRNEARSTSKTAHTERMDELDSKLTTITSQIIGILEKLDGYKMAFDLRNIVTKTILAEKTSRNKFHSDIRNQIENIKKSFSEFNTEIATLVHNQSFLLSTNHEAFTEKMTRQVAEVYHQMYTDIGDITSELNKVTEKVSKMNTEISTLNEIIEDKTDGAWSGWSSWGSCSVTCGGGIRLQTRTCTNPKPSLQGRYCNGAPMKVIVCNIQTCPDHKVAFTAYGTTGTLPVVFPHIIENYGNGYDKSTGRFTCKVPGIYNFSVQITKRHGVFRDFVSCYIYQNSVQELGANEDPYGDGDNDKGAYSISVSGTFHLNKNDYVYIGCYGISAVSTGRKSSFTGFLVTPDN